MRWNLTVEAWLTTLMPHPRPREFLRTLLAWLMDLLTCKATFSKTEFASTQSAIVATLSSNSWPSTKSQVSKRELTVSLVSQITTTNPKRDLTLSSPSRIKELSAKHVLVSVLLPRLLTLFSETGTLLRSLVSSTLSRLTPISLIL